MTHTPSGASVAELSGSELARQDIAAHLHPYTNLAAHAEVGPMVIRRGDGTWIRGGLHGQGLLDHRAILSALVGGGYDGTLAFEYEGPLDHCESTRQGLAYLRQVLDEVRG